MPVDKRQIPGQLDQLKTLVDSLRNEIRDLPPKKNYAVKKAADPKAAPANPVKKEDKKKGEKGEKGQKGQAKEEKRKKGQDR